MCNNELQVGYQFFAEARLRSFHFSRHSSEIPSIRSQSYATCFAHMLRVRSERSSHSIEVSKSSLRRPRKYTSTRAPPRFPRPFAAHRSFLMPDEPGITSPRSGLQTRIPRALRFPQPDQLSGLCLEPWQLQDRDLGRVIQPFQYTAARYRGIVRTKRPSTEERTIAD